MRSLWFWYKVIMSPPNASSKSPPKANPLTTAITGFDLQSALKILNGQWTKNSYETSTLASILRMNSSSRFGSSRDIVIALLGHTRSHRPHPRHFS